MAKNPIDLAKQLESEGMKPGTPLNMPSHSVWVQTNDGWKLYSGRDGADGFNRLSYMPKYKNAMLTKNGQSPEERIKEMDDFDLFDSIYYPAWKMGRDNYLEGEEETIWNDLNKHFDLPPYEQGKYHFNVNPNSRTVDLSTNGISDGRGFGGWKVKPEILGPLKRRV